MKKYLGVKIVDAEPAWKGYLFPQNGCDQSEQIIPKLTYLNDNVSTEWKDGYKVVYEDGYISWSPKDVFESSYKEMLEFVDSDGIYQPHQDRVILETRELQDKVTKLNIFIDTNTTFATLDLDEQNRLRKQLQAMIYYLTILVERINNFN